MKNVRLVKNQYSINIGSVHGYMYMYIMYMDRYFSCNGKSNLLLYAKQFDAKLHQDY